jgi:hypothetical protein
MPCIRLGSSYMTVFALSVFAYCVCRKVSSRKPLHHPGQSPCHGHIPACTIVQLTETVGSAPPSPTATCNRDHTAAADTTIKCRISRNTLLPRTEPFARQTRTICVTLKHQGWGARAQSALIPYTTSYGLSNCLDVSSVQPQTLPQDKAVRCLL